ncbi:CLUMA_CG003733, isoform A [Clunio marinus]|uniref:Pyruvate kinase n=1 Tax=Clunio marinus TaxID=568069 RepID=A0A1J1HPM7_9DIPT|nr:CLUMA_CG003733, isoform A [Clunio marinus]
MKKSKLNLFNDLVMYTPGNNKRKSFRSTKIIATIKRETSREEILGMITAGMNVARFDASSGKKEDFENIVASLKVFKEVVNECNKSGAIKSENFFVTHIACALDLKGVYLESEIYGKSGDPDVKLSRGDKIIFTNHSERKTKSTSLCVYINYRNLSKFKLGQPIIINENIHLIVESIERAPLEALICDVVKGGKFVCGERMEVNFPGAKADLDLEAITEDTISAINFCKKNEIDLLFVSVNKPSDLVKINCHVKADGGLHTVKVIAKIECEVVLQFIEMIIEQSDGFMISRARLGRNISPELVTAFQKNVIAECL